VDDTANGWNPYPEKKSEPSTPEPATEEPADEDLQSDELKYRCEQVSIMRLNGVMINNTETKRDFNVKRVWQNGDLLVRVQMTDNIINVNPSTIEEAVGLLAGLDKVMCSDVSIKVDNQTGKIAKFLNFKEILDRWEVHKKELKSQYSYLRTDDHKQKFDNFINLAEKGITDPNGLAEQLNAKMFFDLFFDKYLVSTDGLQEPYTRCFHSMLFEGISMNLNISQTITNESREIVCVKRVSEIDKHTLDLSAIKKIYEKKYQPNIQYKFSNYNYSLKENRILNVEKRYIEQSNVTIVEEVANNLEVIIDYKLRKIV
jgi:hypothetical protein